jgi:hypothetical protein
LPAIPTAVRKFADSIQHPIALIGCHTSEMSLDCCEYDLAVFVTEQQNNQFMQINDHAVELLYFAGPVLDYILELGCMTILKDTNKFTLSSAARYITPEKYGKALLAAGKKSLISSLFCQQKMHQANPPAVAAMWLKIAS